MGRISGIHRVIQILDFLRQNGESASGYNIARSIGASTSTVYPIIDDLIANDVLSKRNGNEIWLGPRLYWYGIAFSQSVELLQVARLEMERLNKETGETIQICVQDKNDMLIVAMAESSEHFIVNSRVGTRVPLNWTASGQLLVGHLDYEAKVQFFRNSAKPSPSGKSKTDPEQLALDSERAFKERISVKSSESDFAVACVASPICNADGICESTIAIVLPEQRLADNRKWAVEAARNASLRVEQALGWRLPPEVDLA